MIREDRAFFVLFWLRVGLGAYPLLRVLPLAVSLLQRVTFDKRLKSNQKVLPRRTALRLGSVFPRYGVHPGASPPVCFAAPPLDVCGFAAWRCAPNPLMDTFARPAEGAEGQKPHQEPKPKPKADQKIAAFGSSYMGLGLFN